MSITISLIFAINTNLTPGPLAGNGQHWRPRGTGTLLEMGEHAGRLTLALPAHGVRPPWFLVRWSREDTKHCNMAVRQRD